MVLVSFSSLRSHSERGLIVIILSPISYLLGNNALAIAKSVQATPSGVAEWEYDLLWGGHITQFEVV
jgi:hypothetical protein